MNIIGKKLLLIGFVIILIIISLAVSYFYTGSMPSVFSEGFEIMTDTYNRNDILQKDKDGNIINSIPNGYYQISTDKYAKLPYGTMVGPLPMDGIIPEGYYIVNVTDSNNRNYTKMAKVPSGYIATLDKKDIMPITKGSAYSQLQTNSPTNNLQGDTTGTGMNDGSNVLDNKEYNPLNTDVLYHDEPTGKDDSQECTYVKDKSGNLVCLPNTLDNTLPTYYQPGSFIFSSSNYVPNYEDSVYLSISTGLSTVGNAYPTSSAMGGFCNAYIKNPLELEQKCLATDTNTCASTSCCVLLGGSKCVSGNASGPTMKANYSDPSISSKDFYYFNGMCYGNCK